MINCETEIQTNKGETLKVNIKESEPTTIFLNESRLAWERRQSLVCEEKEIISKTKN